MGQRGDRSRSGLLHRFSVLFLLLREPAVAFLDASTTGSTSQAVTDASFPLCCSPSLLIPAPFNHSIISSDRSLNRLLGSAGRAFSPHLSWRAGAPREAALGLESFSQHVGAAGIHPRLFLISPQHRRREICKWCTFVPKRRQGSKLRFKTVTFILRLY